MSSTESLVSFRSVDVFERLVVHFLLEIVHDGLGRLGGGFERHQGHLLLGIGQLVTVVLEVFICQLTAPVNHALVLGLPALVLSVHLFVRAIILEEACVVLRVLRQLGISEEVEHLLHVLADPFELIRRVAVNICIVTLG